MPELPEVETVKNELAPHVIGRTITGVTITDSLDGAARARHVSTSLLAVRAAAAGTDMLLLTGSEGASLGVYRALVEAAGAGRIGHARLVASHGRILALKAGLAAR